VPKLSLQVSDRVRFERFLVSLDLLFFWVHNDLLSKMISEKGIHPTGHGLRQSQRYVAPAIAAFGIHGPTGSMG
jgi:hypothetical protein